jgi:hypothetical protein
MNEALTGSSRPREPAVPVDLKTRLEQLARGECSADDFVRDSLAGRGRSTDSWELLSFIDQRYRLGQLPDELFQSIKSRIAWSELQDKEFGTTVELTPAPRKTSTAASSTNAAQRTPAANVRATATAPVLAFTAARQAPVTVIAAPAASAASAIAAQAGASLAVEDIQQIIAPAPEAPVPAPLQPGRVLGGRYELESILGSGGMGTVFKAVDRRGVLPAQAERRVALKVLREPIGRSAAAQVQLRREFVCSQALSHPNIVKVHELDSDAGIAFYTMELLSGEPLSAIIARARPAALPRHYAWAVIRAVGGAIAHAHARHVIHGDLKPQNVMITAENEVRVLDFGSSRTAHDADAEERLTATPPYASCDVLEGEQPDPRDDLYSLACLSHELLGGHHPFHGRSAVEARAAGLQAHRPAGLSPEQWRALQTGLSWSRAERSVPVVEWLERLGLVIEPQCLPDLRAGAAPESPAAPSFPASDFALPAMVAVAALLIALAAGRGARPARVEIAAAPAAAVPTRALPAAAAPEARASSGSSTPAAVPAATAAVPANQKAAPPPATGPAARSAPASASASTALAPDLKPASPVAGSGEPRERAVAAPTLRLTASAIRLRRGASFAEIRVAREGDVGDFAWWTDDGSAVAGSDYVAQPRVTRAFSRGLRSATIYVRLTANPERRRARTFYVQIAPTAKGVRTGTARTAIIVSGSR